MDRPLSQDFFLELMRESQGARAGLLAERDGWTRTLALHGREEVLFELELMLRGLDRFFIQRNLFGESAPAIDRDFHEELKAGRDAIHRAVHLARRLTLQREEQQLLFRSFVAEAIADDRARAKLGAELREQRTPEESLFLLRAGLVAHEGILDNLIRLEHLPQSLFLAVGRALQHEIFVSRYFSPSGPLEFRAEYDRIGSMRLLEALHALHDEKSRRAFAVALLAAFRALRSLRFVPPPPAVHTRRVLVILALVRAELLSLVGYLENELPSLLATPEGVGPAAQIGRSAGAHLREALALVPPLLTSPLTERRQLDEMRDQLTSAIKSAIGVLAQPIAPDLDRRVLFEDDPVREHSERLRRDLWVFCELCRTTAHNLDASSPDRSATASLRKFAGEFRDVGYQLLRHADRELFDRFIALVEAWSSAATDSSRTQRLRDDCIRFAEILYRAVELVSRRAELVNRPIDKESYQQALAQRIASS